MVKTRLIPLLLLKNGRLIKTKQFDTFRDVGNPITVAKVYEAQNADEIIFLDISASEEQRLPPLEVISEFASQCFIPVTVGGGIRSVDDARAVLHSGADKIAINALAIESPKTIQTLAEEFGSSTIVASIDYKRNSAGRNEVFSHRARRATGLDPLRLAQDVERFGAGEILLTNVDREGTMTGYDIETIRTVSDQIGIPVIASGGAGTVNDFVKAIVDGHASAVCAGSIFHFTDQSIFKGHTFLRQSNVSVRV